MGQTSYQAALPRDIKSIIRLFFEMSNVAGVGGAPFRDFAVVTREENVGDFHATEVGGLGVLGIFEVVAVRERLDKRGSFATQNARNEADDGVDQDEGGQFPAGQNVVSEGELVVNEGQDALVVAFVMGANDNIVRVFVGGLREFSRLVFGPESAFRGREEDFRGFIFRFYGLDGGKKGLRAEKHAVAAAVRGVVDGLVGAEAEVAEVHKIEFREALIGGFPHHGSPEIGLQGVFEEGDEGEFQHI